VTSLPSILEAPLGANLKEKDAAAGGDPAAAVYDGEHAYWAAPSAVAAALGTSIEGGLSDAEAKERLARDGPNKLEGEEGVGVWKVLLRQVSNSLTLVC